MNLVYNYIQNQSKYLDKKKMKKNFYEDTKIRISIFYLYYITYYDFLVIVSFKFFFVRWIWFRYIEVLNTVLRLFKSIKFILMS